MKLKILLLIATIILNISCSKDKEQKIIISQKNIENQMLEAYEEGVQELKRGDVLFAAKRFNEAEMLFPQSELAPKAALMAAYAYYSQDYYGDSIAELVRFMKVYPNYKDKDYAEYLLALSYYEQIVDEKKDLRSIVNAKKQFLKVIKNYPQTEYADDAAFKIDLIDDILAAKELYIGRYYLDKKKWISAINRFRIVVDDYETTIYVEEALHRLVEVYYILGLKEEAEKYANLLGYNYQSSEWYEKTYSVFNRMYKKNKQDNEKKAKKKSNNFIKKFKSLFN
jgi:outer membrane protein assembly factor BamD